MPVTLDVLAALAALGIWFSLRGRVPLWLLVILTVVLAPLGGLLLTMVFTMIYVCRSSPFEWDAVRIWGALRETPLQVPCGSGLWCV
jgi:hypothetical protein